MTNMQFIKLNKFILSPLVLAVLLALFTMNVMLILIIASIALAFIMLLNDRYSLVSTNDFETIRESFEKSDKTKLPTILSAQYSEYLKSDRWHTLRHKIMKRDNFECVQCWKTDNLQVHHKTYGGCFVTPMNFNPAQLITLCTSCHNYIHKRK